MIVPRFDSVELGEDRPPADSTQQWEELIDEVPSNNKSRQTPEHILVPPVYADEAYAGLDFLGTYPGIPPFLRGASATM